MAYSEVAWQPNRKPLDIQDTLVASLLSDENFSPTRPVSMEETGLGEEFIEQTHLQVPGGVRHQQGPNDCRQYLSSLPHRGDDAGNAADQPVRGPCRLGLLQRLLLQPDEPGAVAGDGLPGNLRLRRPRARAVDGLRDLGRGPIDHRRNPRPGKTGRGGARDFRRSRPVRKPGAGHQFGRRHVPLRSAGKRQIDLGQADHLVLWAGNLDSPCPLRRRPGDQVLRLGLSQAGGQRRAQHHQVRRIRPPLAEDSRAPPWSSAAN